MIMIKCSAEELQIMDCAWLARKKFNQDNSFPFSTNFEVFCGKCNEIELPSLYFSHTRPVVKRNGTILAATDFITLQSGEVVEEKQVRFRTIGDATCTGAIESSATDVETIIAEVAAAHQTERGNRADDKRSTTAMEDRKRQGYF